jgi:hypothetical protein
MSTEFNQSLGLSFSSAYLFVFTLCILKDLFGTHENQIGSQENTSIKTTALIICLLQSRIEYLGGDDNDLGLMNQLTDGMKG